MEGTALMTGGLALDGGLVAALRESLAEVRSALVVRSHPDSIYAGAIGAALWGAFRHEKLQARGRGPVVVAGRAA
jgi:benzoyl-CoA reductase subunit D